MCGRSVKRSASGIFPGCTSPTAGTRTPRNQNQPTISTGAAAPPAARRT